MKQGRGAAAQHERRREEILLAALACFADRGFRTTTMADIARRGGMSAGNLYNYFESKGAIVEELSRLELKKLHELKRDFTENPFSREEHAGWLKMLATTRLDPRRARLAMEILAEASRSGNTIFSIVAEIDASWRDLIARFYEAFTDMPPERIAARVENDLALLNGLSMRIVSNPGLDADAVADEFVRMATGGVHVTCWD